MTFLELARARYSVRKFSPDPVDPDDFSAVLEAARLAPSACNNQPVRIIVASEPEMLARVRETTTYHFNAPVLLAIFFDTAATWKDPVTGKNSGDTDAAIVTTHLILAAAEHGLGTTYVGSFDAAKLKKNLGVPASWEAHALLPLGIPDAEAHPAPMHAKRKPLSETVFFDRVPGEPAEGDDSE